MGRFIFNRVRPINGWFVKDADINKRRRKIDVIGKEYFKNKGYKNFGYFLNIGITNTSQTLQDTGGTNRTMDGNYNTGVIIGAMPYNSFMGLNLGSSSDPHDVSRYELISRHFNTPMNGIAWVDEDNGKLVLQTFSTYVIPDSSRTVGEVGLYLTSAYMPCFLIARSIPSSPFTRNYNTWYRDGWKITFPSNYTKYYLTVALTKNTWNLGEQWGSLVKDVNGNYYVIRQHSPFSGSPDVMIGSDNTPPNFEDYALKSPIGSLSSQSQSVEVDTVNQEVRVVRTGTYTPSSSVYLGEVGLFTNLYDTSGTARKVMIVRGVWDTPILLSSGTTYTIGIVLVLG
ncbi:MAG: hypothetical protein QXS21_05905 [Thermoproteota archaeon]